MKCLYILALSGIGNFARKSMLEDVQALVLEVMFQGTLARSCRRRFYNVDDYRYVPAGVFEYELVRTPKMARAAVVCRA